MKMVTEDYVSFETAKLLKERGFDWETCGYWDLTTATHTHKIGIEPTSKNWNFKWNPIAFPISAPTLQMAMKWLRENHNMFIRIIQSHIDYCTYEVYYDRAKHYESIESYNTYEEACEAAIKYCLENLI